jgi:DNA recombination protein RmuC
MLVAILVFSVLGTLLLAGVFTLLLRMPGSAAQGELRVALEKALGDQKADFRDVNAASGEQLRQLVQQSLTQQQLVLEQRFSALQQQTDLRLQEIRANVEKRLQENLEQNFGAFKEMSQSLALLKSSADQMLRISEQVGELNHILASPKLQGNFGETALEKLLADILPPQAYEWQPRIAEGLQPDAAVKIKNIRLCIDAKFPKDRIAQVLDEARDEPAREVARKELASVIKQMAGDISKKYVRPDLGTADQAFLFVPSESLYYEILKMPELAEHCRKVKVCPVSPNTLAATLYAVALAFRGYEMQENAKTLLKGIQDMDRHFQNFREDFLKVGQRLQQAQEDYTKAGRDLERFDKTIAKLKDGEAGLQLD